MDALAAILARILIGGYFALSGANNLLDLSLAVRRASEAGVPAAPLFVVVIALFKLILGILIMIKLHTKLAAACLIVYIIVSSLLFYNPLTWDESSQSQVVFLRNVAILGGLLILYAHSRGLRLVRDEHVNL